MLAIAKQANLGGVNSRIPLLRNQGTTVYDIWSIVWTQSFISLLAANQFSVAALSTRLIDQVEDAVAIPLNDFYTANGIFGMFSSSQDLVVEGGGGIVAGRIINFPAGKPYRVPFASFISLGTSGGDQRLGCEVYFERVEVSSIEKATLVRIQAGGRTRPGD